MQYGFILVASLVANILCEHYLDEHTFAYNINTGFAF
jgi:hypothetical protein